MAVSANRLELLQIADAVAREKSIDRMIVIQSMQDAIEKAAKTRYGAETDVRAEINPRTGELRLTRLREVVEDVEEPARQITLPEAQARNAAAKLGDFVGEPLPPIEFGRIAAQSAKQVIVQKVRDAERDRMYEEYINRVGEIVNGTVKRVEYGNVIVDLGRGEAIIRRDELIPREMYRYGDRVRAYIYDVRREQRGPQIFLSRTHPQFMAKLFMQEVPEIYDGIITIRSIARDPGSRAKIAVTSNDSSIDPVGACVGMRGSRVQAVVGELQGEKIDIIPWTENIADLVVSALHNQDEVDRFMAMTDPKLFGLSPDTAHLYLGGCNVVETFNHYKHRIRFCDYKDAKWTTPTKDWVEPNGIVVPKDSPQARFLNSIYDLGDGEVDFPGCHRVLKSVEYQGWICVDLDSARMGPRPDYERCGDYIVNKLQPIYM